MDPGKHFLIKTNRDYTKITKNSLIRTQSLYEINPSLIKLIPLLASVKI